MGPFSDIVSCRISCCVIQTFYGQGGETPVGGGGSSTQLGLIGDVDVRPKLENFIIFILIYFILNGSHLFISLPFQGGNLKARVLWGTETGLWF